jgi:hypothetical protein
MIVSYREVFDDTLHKLILIPTYKYLDDKEETRSRHLIVLVRRNPFHDPMKIHDAHLGTHHLKD